MNGKNIQRFAEHQNMMNIQFNICKLNFRFISIFNEKKRKKWAIKR